ncbi:MAG: hypothetical protein E7674_03595 [Ruminococcaceae bacterium]|nr:hypothetical protein [Oscillospiraceae bacterium]
MSKKKLIIVYDKNTKIAANHLLQLISAKDDTDDTQVGTKDGQVDAVIWNETEYESNRPMLNSSQKILFIGDTKISKEMRCHIPDTFNEIGMHYGWLGAQAFAYIEKFKLTKDTEKKLDKLLEKYGDKFNDEFLVKLSPYGVKNAVVSTSLALLTGGASLFVEGALGKAKHDKTINKLYMLLVVILYIDGLSSFIGENA